MIICTECGLVFDKAAKYTEPHGEVVYGCPRCDSNSIEEAEKCECGNYMTKSDWICGTCSTVLKRRFMRFWEGLTRNEKEFVTELMEEA